MINKNFQLIATTTFGLEAVVRRELECLGYEIDQVDNGRIFFSGDIRDIARANLWLRSADRVLIELAEFEATEFEDVYQGVQSVDWPAILPQNAKFVISGKSVRSNLFSVRTLQSITERSIIDSLRTVYNIKRFPKSGALYDIEISMLDDRASITLDTSGRGLHRRGYRMTSPTAPIRETLAAALVQLSFWNKDRLLYDPFCGSGTILIEAAMIGKNIAPGLKRSFAFNNWQGVSHDILRDLKEQAKAEIIDADLRIYGSDIDCDVIETARDSVEFMDLEDDIHLECRDFRDGVIHYEDYGVTITNPPYGDRFEDINIPKLEKDLGEILRPLSTWSNYIITSDGSFERNYGKRADRRRKLFNGNIQTQYYQYYGPRPPR